MDLIKFIGVPGIDGQKGVDGADGIKGADGVDGKPGKDGADGRRGQNSPGKWVGSGNNRRYVQGKGGNGTKGGNGGNGTNGTNGKPGTDGKNGTNGKNGTHGKNGTSFKGTISFENERILLKGNNNIFTIEGLVCIDVSGGNGGNGGTAGRGGSGGHGGRAGKGGRAGSGGRGGAGGSGSPYGQSGANGADGVRGNDGVPGRNGKDGENGVGGNGGNGGNSGNVFVSTNDSHLLLLLSSQCNGGSGGNGGWRRPYGSHGASGSDGTCIYEFKTKNTKEEDSELGIEIQAMGSDSDDFRNFNLTQDSQFVINKFELSNSHGITIHAPFSIRCESDSEITLEKSFFEVSKTSVKANDSVVATDDQVKGRIAQDCEPGYFNIVTTAISKRGKVTIQLSESSSYAFKVNLRINPEIIPTYCESENSFLSQKKDIWNDMDPEDQFYLFSSYLLAPIAQNLEIRTKIIKTLISTFEVSFLKEDILEEVLGKYLTSSDYLSFQELLTYTAIYFYSLIPSHSKYRKILDVLFDQNLSDSEKEYVRKVSYGLDINEQWLSHTMPDKLGLGVEIDELQINYDESLLNGNLTSGSYFTITGVKVRNYYYFDVQMPEVCTKRNQMELIEPKSTSILLGSILGANDKIYVSSNIIYQLNDQCDVGYYTLQNGVKGKAPVELANWTHCITIPVNHRLSNILCDQFNDVEKSFFQRKQVEWNSLLPEEQFSLFSAFLLAPLFIKQVLNKKQKDTVIGKIKEIFQDSLFQPELFNAKLFECVEYDELKENHQVLTHVGIDFYSHLSKSFRLKIVNCLYFTATGDKVFEQREKDYIKKIANAIGFDDEWLMEHMSQVLVKGDTKIKALEKNTIALMGIPLLMLCLYGLILVVSKFFICDDLSCIQGIVIDYQTSHYLDNTSVVKILDLFLLLPFLFVVSCWSIRKLFFNKSCTNCLSTRLEKIDLKDSATDAYSDYRCKDCRKEGNSTQGNPLEPYSSDLDFASNPNPLYRKKWLFLSIIFIGTLLFSMFFPIVFLISLFYTFISNINKSRRFKDIFLSVGAILIVIVSINFFYTQYATSIDPASFKKYDIIQPYHDIKKTIINMIVELFKNPNNLNSDVSES
ncbi:MAG: hypothetical protein HQM12_23030 [SAR324 cluster bacterium]|nr:hypothetical protein [SAR324 cluster bacterium]